MGDQWGRGGCSEEVPRGPHHKNHPSPSKTLRLLARHANPTDSKHQLVGYSTEGPAKKANYGFWETEA